MTSQILAAIQMANEVHANNMRNQIAQQQVGLQQQAQPSEIALRQAQAGQAQAETTAIPQRLQMQQKEIDANLALRDVIAKSEASYRQGMLGVRTSDEQRKELKDQQTYQLGLMRNTIEEQRAEAYKQGVQGQIAFHNKALDQTKALTEQALILKAQANQLREQGNEIAAEARENQADQIINNASLWRTVAGEVGILPEVRTPSAATPQNPKTPQTPKTPKSPGARPPLSSFEAPTGTNP